ncbi:hypothetical protein MGP47_004435 [Salmonella enterica]|nr:hypothetical protein [Salmonella enterica subsp. enterica serovar Javiana]EIW7310634.1 hypothetical protein [Salmonella enterica]EJM5074488.1 hypothetical protein [Salmonella enterica]
MEIFTSFNQINKSILNYAAKRGIELEIDKESEAVLFWEADQDCEWMFSYGIASRDYTLVWRGNIYLPDAIKEELPAHIMSGEKLKEVINFISSEFLAKQAN